MGHRSCDRQGVTPALATGGSRFLSVGLLCVVPPHLTCPNPPYNPPRMTPRTNRRWALWLLPLIAVQFIFASGVMPGHNEAGATFVLCSVSAGAQGSASHSHHHGSSSSAGHADQACPFAGAASAAPSTAVPSLALELQPSLEAPIALAAQRSAPSGPTRAQLSRAPPSLS